MLAAVLLPPEQTARLKRGSSCHMKDGQLPSSDKLSSNALWKTSPFFFPGLLILLYLKVEKTFQISCLIPDAIRRPRRRRATL